LSEIPSPNPDTDLDTDPDPEAVDMNGIFQMQGGKNWFLPKEMNANRFFCDSHWLEIWSNHFCPSIGPNGGSVAMDSVPNQGFLGLAIFISNVRREHYSCLFFFFLYTIQKYLTQCHGKIITNSYSSRWHRREKYEMQQRSKF
jgi:hypothetical protein